MNALLSFAGKMQSNKVLSAIKDSFIDNMPVVIMGSFCTLFQFTVSITDPGYISLAKVPGMGWLEALTPIWTTANYGCMNFMAVAIVFLVAWHYAENLGHGADKTNAAVALASFVTLMNTTATGTMTAEKINALNPALNATADVNVTIGSAVASSYTAATGLFVALIVGIVSTLLYCALVDSGKLKIKLPDSVPPNVSRSFEVLFPSVIVILVFAVFGFVLNTFFSLNFFALMAKVMAPLQAIMTGLPGYLVIVVIIMLLWWFGIHGANVMGSVTTPFLTAAYAANNAAYAAQQPIPNIICTPFVSTFFSQTGSGITGGLIIAILLFSKRDDFKAIARLAIPCGIFNINEPIIFGIPMVMNPVLAIPFFLAPVVAVATGYFLTATGFSPRMVVDAPWTTPVGILGFLASGGNIKGALAQIISFATSILIYTPFVLATNRQVQAA